MATLALSAGNAKRAEGFLGGFAAFAVANTNIAEAVAALCREFEESDYIVVGIAHMIPSHMLDRTLTEHETALVDAVTSYPVQFKNVHLHKGDG